MEDPGRGRLNILTLSSCIHTQRRCIQTAEVTTAGFLVAASSHHPTIGRCPTLDTMQFLDFATHVPYRGGQLRVLSKMLRLPCETLNSHDASHLSVWWPEMLNIVYTYLTSPVRAYRFCVWTSLSLYLRIHD